MSMGVALRSCLRPCRLAEPGLRMHHTAGQVDKRTASRAPNAYRAGCASACEPGSPRLEAHRLSRSWGGRAAALPWSTAGLAVGPGHWIGRPARHGIYTATTSPGLDFLAGPDEAPDRAPARAPAPHEIYISKGPDAWETCCKTWTFGGGPIATRPVLPALGDAPGQRCANRSATSAS